MGPLEHPFASEYSVHYYDVVLVDEISGPTAILVESTTIQKTNRILLGFADDSDLHDDNNLSGLYEVSGKIDGCEVDDVDGANLCMVTVDRSCSALTVYSPV